MKKTIVTVFAVFLCVGVVVFTANTASSYLSRDVRGGSTGNNNCSGRSGRTHILTLQNDRASTDHINAKRCDTLTVINKDERLRRMSFGIHNQHQAYNGILEKVLLKDQQFSVTLTENGSFVIHDHQQETVGSTFSVSH